MTGTTEGNVHHFSDGCVIAYTLHAPTPTQTRGALH